MEPSSCLLERPNGQQRPFSEPNPAILSALRWFSPFKIITAIRQAWRDYKLGRKLREEGYEGAEPTTGTEQPKRSNRESGWKFQRGSEYPWRIQRTIQGDAEWRGTWVLEVKDIFEVSWTRQKVHDGRKWRWVTLPDAPHWPLPHQDPRS